MKKGGIGRANAVEQSEDSEFYENQNNDINNMSTYLDNLAAAATQEKDVLDRLVSNNEKLVNQLEKLTNKFDQLSSNKNGTSTTNSTVPMLDGKRLKFMQYEKDGHCHSHGYKCIKGHSSKTCTNPRPEHKKEATRRDTKNGSSYHKAWICSYHEERGYRVPVEQQR